MNKHELHNDTPEHPEQAEWNSLTEAVPFSKEAKESPDEISEFVADKYGKILDKFIDACFFEEGDEFNPDDRSNPKNYTASLLLSDYLSMDEQNTIINSCAKGEPVAPEITQKILDGIADIIRKNNLADALKNDPFMRDRRIEEMVKGNAWTEGKDIKEVELINKLWKADDDFFTGAGLSLIYNHDYLCKKCNIEDTADLSKAMQNLIANGQVSAKEIIKDPMLRKRRFSNLTHIEIDNPELDPSLAYIWDLDTGFRNSTDFEIALDDKVRRNPDIYKADDNAEIDRITDEIVEKIPEKHLAEIARVYEKDPKKGDQLLLDLLIPYLGLEANPPKLKYDTIENKQEMGLYSRSEHAITICEENIAANYPDDAPQSVLGIFRSKKPQNSTYARINIIAHEATHAYQWAGANISKDRKEKYEENFTFYLDGHNSSYEDYHKQILEEEAFRLGKKIEERCRRAVEGGKK